MAQPLSVETKAAYDEKLLQFEGKVVVVDFFADWCGPCKMIKPKLEELAASGKAVVLTLNVEESEDVAQELGISAMPTFYIYKNGKKIDELVGANYASLEEKVNKASSS